MALPEFLGPPRRMTAPSAFSADDLGGAGPTAGRIGIRVETQKGDNWCWAAVAVSIARFYGAASTLDQCQLAAENFGTIACGADGKALKEHDDPESLTKILTMTGNLVKVHDASNSPSAPLTFAEIQEQIAAGRVVATRFLWGSGSTVGHFMAIFGWIVASSGDEFIEITDPLEGAGETFTRYADFLSSYRNQKGRWDYGYVTAPVAVVAGADGRAADAVLTSALGIGGTSVGGG